MASITIRNIDEETKHRLRLAAAAKGRSMEEEVRATLRERYRVEPKKGLGTRVHELFKPLGGVELELLPRNGTQLPPVSAGTETGSWVDDIVKTFQEIGGVELELPLRQKARKPPDFSG